jgi:putative ubiquitin-RnfH superfamily antitoxin RatB of RatAB toxin-antitoxin module
MGDSNGAAHAPVIHVTVVACVAPRECREWTLALPAGSCVGDALRASGVDAVGEKWGLDTIRLGIWGRAATAGALLNDLDRVEVYRALKVDPKVARRERFARQGARTTGLFARQRPGGKSGY